MHENNSVFDPDKFKSQLVKLAEWDMPFGKYAGRKLIDLPEAYLLWFRDKGWPNGELGELLAFSLEMHIAGTTGLVKKLKS